MDLMDEGYKLISLGVVSNGTPLSTSRIPNSLLDRRMHPPLVNRHVEEVQAPIFVATNNEQWDDHSRKQNWSPKHLLVR